MGIGQVKASGIVDRSFVQSCVSVVHALGIDGIGVASDAVDTEEIDLEPSGIVVGGTHSVVALVTRLDADGEVFAFAHLDFHLHIAEYEVRGVASGIAGISVHLVRGE